MSPPDVAIVPDSKALASGATFRFRAPSSLLRELAPVMSFDGAVACLRRSSSITAVIENGDAFTKVTLPPAIALSLLDATSPSPLLFAEPMMPSVQRAAEALFDENDLGLASSVRVSLVISRAGRSTQAHYDDVTGINIQLVGRKAWRISEAPSTAPVHESELAFAGASEASSRDALERSLGHTVIMQPGDGVYLPAGTVHAVDGIDDSVSLQISCRSNDVRWVDALVGLATKLMIDDADARRSFVPYGRMSHAENAARGAALLDRLGERLRSIRAEHLLPAMTDDETDDGYASWNPAATLRIDPSASAATRVVVTTGIAGTTGETGRMEMSRANARELRALRSSPRIDRATLADRMGNRATALYGALIALGVIVPENPES